MYLADTNIFLEVLLNQQRSDDVVELFSKTPLEKIFISEFSFYSIGLFLLNRKKSDLFLKFIDDLFLNGQLQVLKLEPLHMKQLIENSKQFSLDFDDAYQYTIIQVYSLVLISFDKDFDRTMAGRKTPKEICG
ncbi:MAG: type II toxin-antitoxin system VapC family toxin [Deltaproteobacteria bacterium]|nr:type II toxin-antitoxin system VapC family toxin [Deltaproteobacteria bacterium]